MSTTGTIEYTKFGEALRQEILKELLAVSLQLEGLFKLNAPEATSALKGSFESDAMQTQEGVAVKVGTPLAYGAAVEFGTKPHWLPIHALIRWVDEKQLDRISRFIKRGVTSRASRKVREGQKYSQREKEIRSIAFAIQKKIAKHGTRPQKFMEKSLRQFGLDFKVVNRGSDYAYEINLEKYLLPKLAELEARAAAKLNI